jgi:peptidoglycan/xylan/chitin deacetylase (PgdA/CDA1 family)
MYHQVDLPAARGTQYRSLTVHPQSFARQMRWMHRLGYRGLSMRDLTPYLTGEREGKVFGITFDDGFRNVYQYALPVLKQAGFTSTNYFVAHQLDGSNVWDADKNMPQTPLMSLAEMREWAAAGQEVGSHTLNHVHLPLLTEEQARAEIIASRLKLSDYVQQEVTAFCYPFGEYSAQHCLMAKEAGYLNATTTERGLARADDDFFELPRVGIWRSTNLLKFFQKCLTQYEDRKRG